MTEDPTAQLRRMLDEGRRRDADELANAPDAEARTEILLRRLRLRAERSAALEHLVSDVGARSDVTFRNDRSITVICSNGHPRVTIATGIERVGSSTGRFKYIKFDIPARAMGGYHSLRFKCPGCTDLSARDTLLEPILKKCLEGGVHEIELRHMQRLYDARVYEARRDQ